MPFLPIDKDGKCEIFAVIHFAGLKAVGESVSQPLRYYTNNLTGICNFIYLFVNLPSIVLTPTVQVPSTFLIPCRRTV